MQNANLDSMDDADRYMEILLADAKAHPTYRPHQFVRCYSHTRERYLLGEGRVYAILWNNSTDQYVMKVKFWDGRVSDWLSASQLETIDPAEMRRRFHSIKWS